jgi:hypothetical protein
MSRSWVFAVWLLVLVVAAGVVAGIARSESRRAPRFTPAPYTASPVGPAAGQVPSDLRIVEILASPHGTGTRTARSSRARTSGRASQPGRGPVTLGEYFLSDNDSTIRVVPTGTLLPGAIVVVTGKMAEDWQRFAGRTVSGLSLNNTGDTVRLFHMTTTDTVEVDTKTYNSIEEGPTARRGSSATCLPPTGSCSTG